MAKKKKNSRMRFRSYLCIYVDLFELKVTVKSQLTVFVYFMEYCSICIINDLYAHIYDI